MDQLFRIRNNYQSKPVHLREMSTHAISPKRVALEQAFQEVAGGVPICSKVFYHNRKQWHFIKFYAVHGKPEYPLVEYAEKELRKTYPCGSMPNRWDDILQHCSSLSALSDSGVF